MVGKVVLIYYYNIMVLVFFLIINITCPLTNFVIFLPIFLSHLKHEIFSISICFIYIIFNSSSFDHFSLVIEFQINKRFIIFQDGRNNVICCIKKIFLHLEHVIPYLVFVPLILFVLAILKFPSCT